METLEQLSRRIAEFDPNWAKPGMRCVDPVTGAAWRLLAYLAHGWNFDNRRAEMLEPTDDPDDMLIRAIAAGPDASDAATLGAILLGLDPADRPVHRNGVWSWSTPYTGVMHSTNEAEAILRAEVARLEANNKDKVTQ